MIDKFKIYKLTFLIMVCHISYRSVSQISPLTAPPTNFSGTYSSGTQNNSAPNAVLNTVNVSGTTVYDMKAGYSIGVLPGSSAANFSTGSCALHIQPPAFEVVSYHTNGFNNIPRYDKFELGIKLPTGLTDSINNFFGANYHVNANVYPCNPGYGNEFNIGSNCINPYDPDQISIEATFNFPGKPSETIYGFYYRDYSYHYNSGNAMTYSNADWVEDLTLQYHWRVRFAPKYIGTYTVTWVIRGANNAILYQDNIGQNFTTVTSTSLGFIKMGVNNKFFVTQPDSSSQQKTILPVGVCNISVSAARRQADDPYDDLTNYDAPSFGDANGYNFCYPSRYYRYRQKIKTRIAEQGANIVRVFSVPYTFNIEQEKVGIYDASPQRPLVPVSLGLTSVPLHAPFTGFPTPAHYKGTNRQAVMWEFDRLLDMAKTSTDAGNPIYIQWVTQNFEGGFFGTNVDNGIFNWPNYNPYYQIINNPKNPAVIDQFFTDINAIKAYKKRLRYMIARYGYSTNLANLELVNEIQEFNKGNNTTQSLDNLFAPWLTIMTNYIKNPVSNGGLGHTDHLLTVSQNSTQQLPLNNNIGSIQKLDFLSTHPYNNADITFSNAYLDVYLYKSTYNKPCQAGEMGLLSGWECASKQMFPELMSPTFHTLLWSTTFIGGPTSGLEMWDKGLDIDPNNNIPYSSTNLTGPHLRAHPCGDGFIQHFKPLRAFIKDIDFDQGNYTPVYNKTSGPTFIEAFYLIDNNQWLANHAIGYVRNSTFWWSNFSNSNSGSPYYDSTLTSDFYSLYYPTSQNCPNPTIPVSLPFNQPVVSGNLSNTYGGISVPGLTHYTDYVVEWYNTYVDPAVSNPLITSYVVSTNYYHGITIFPPTFGGCTQQEFGFKIYPLPAKHLTSQNNSSIRELSVSKTDVSMDIQIYPNPSNAIFNIKYTNDMDVTSVTIIDNLGRTIKTVNGKPFSIDLNSYSRGLYQLQFKTEKTIITKKIMLSN